MKVPFLSRLQAFANSGTTPVSGQEEAKAAQMVKDVLAALPELLAVAVIDVERGQALASYSSVRELNPAKAAPYNAEVVRQKRRALEALQLPNEKIEDILITMREQLHLLRVTHDGRQILYLAVHSQDTNLAIARSVLHAHSA